jgi:hypothetical protein
MCRQNLVGCSSRCFGAAKKIIPLLRYADNDGKETPMKPKSPYDRTVTIEREEYDALMSDLPTPEVSSGSPELEERFRRIEFYMLIIVGVILIVFILCKGN